MPGTEQPVHTSLDPSPARIFDWVVAAILGTYTELLTEILRRFGLDMRSPMVHWEVTTVFWVTLFTAMLIVPIYLPTKASEKLANRRVERVIFIVSLLVTAFLMPPLDWFARLASH
jgi:hypothetical protein